jgi:hypothetical protein
VVFPLSTTNALQDHLAIGDELVCQKILMHCKEIIKHGWHMVSKFGKRALVIVQMIINQ